MGFLAAMIGMNAIFTEFGKCVDAKVSRMFGMLYTEDIVSMIYTLLIPGDRDAAWQHWFSQLDMIVRIPGHTGWQRFVICICRRLPFRLVANIFCRWPHALKVMGVHR